MAKSKGIYSGGKKVGYAVPSGKKTTGLFVGGKGKAGYIGRIKSK